MSDTKTTRGLSLEPYQVIIRPVVTEKSTSQSQEDRLNAYTFEVHLEAGDVMVQRGTYHSWINRGTVPCRLAAVLVDAKR